VPQPGWRRIASGPTKRHGVRGSGPRSKDPAGGRRAIPPGKSNNRRPGSTRERPPCPDRRPLARGAAYGGLRPPEVRASAVREPHGSGRDRAGGLPWPRAATRAGHSPGPCRRDIPSSRFPGRSHGRSRPPGHLRGSRANLVRPGSRRATVQRATSPSRAFRPRTSPLRPRSPARCAGLKSAEIRPSRSAAGPRFPWREGDRRPCEDRCDPSGSGHGYRAR